MSRTFALGQVAATPGALELVGAPANSGLLRRHAAGDWGDLGAFDRCENDRALRDGTRIFLSYETLEGKVWIITESDRSSTCILLPLEY